MKILNKEELKKLARVIRWMKVHNIPLKSLFFLSGGQGMDMVEKELLKRKIEIK